MTIGFAPPNPPKYFANMRFYAVPSDMFIEYA